MSAAPPNDEHSPAFDVVIVGAGLSGLTYGNVAAAKGYRVAIVEQHFKAGGYATNFARMKRKIMFDCSLHKITGLGPRGNLRDALERAGLWNLVSFEMYRDLTAVIVDGHQYDLAADYDQMKAQLFRYFPEEQQGLAKLFADIESHGYQNYMVARMALGEYQLNLDLLEGSRALSRITAKSYFRSLFKHKHLVIIFSSIAINLGVVADDIDALYFLHFAFTFFATGAGFIRGTSQALSDALTKEFAARGGQMFLGEAVQRIELREGRVHQVSTKRRTLPASEVVATCSPHDIAKMVDDEELGPIFLEKLDRLKFGLGHFGVYLVTDRPPESFGFIRSEYIVAPPVDRTLTPEDVATDARYETWPIEVTNYHLLEPGSGPVLQFTILDHRARWFELSKEAYKQEKARVQALLLQRVLAAFPVLAEHIVYIESSTPRTNYRYTKSPDGSAFGYKATPGRNVRFLRSCRPKGITFVGTWVVGAGYEPAICLGFTEAYLRPDKHRSVDHVGFVNAQSVGESS